MYSNSFAKQPSWCCQTLTDSKIYISSITELELYGKRNLSDKEIAILDELINQCIVIDLIEPIKEIVKKLNQKHSIKLPDAIIAASSIYTDIPMVTFDNDFRKLTELKLILFED
ncbi:VapC toxin family PIN domain ribonuclease [Brumimicrobium salinarum]|uniref:VapC toxin family PIN domain ribonuclease n=1 Tax=Brumimicrobium salinarum TaxID=2058658 RepID=A0A2I0R0D5_9FLAO|nr:VapC toxin family PIN domain ribonuclease [Brumimicrobium salinarum]